MARSYEGFSLRPAAMLWNDDLLLVGIIDFPQRRTASLPDDEQKLVVSYFAAIELPYNYFNNPLFTQTPNFLWLRQPGSLAFQPATLLGIVGFQAYVMRPTSNPARDRRLPRLTKKYGVRP